MPVSIRPLWQRIVDEVLTSDDGWVAEISRPEQPCNPDYWRMSGSGQCLVVRTLTRMGLGFDHPMLPNPPTPRARRAMAWGSVTHELVEHMIKRYSLEWDMGVVSFIEKELVNPGWNAIGHMDWRYQLDKEIEYLNWKTGPGSADYDLKNTHPQVFRYTKKSLATSKDPNTAHIHWWQSSGYGITKELLGVPRVKHYRVWLVAHSDFRDAEFDLYRSPAWVEALDQDYYYLNEHWDAGTMPPCTCDTQRNAWLVKKSLCHYMKIGDPCCFRGLGITKVEDAMAYLDKHAAGQKALNGEVEINGAY